MRAIHVFTYYGSRAPDYLKIIEIGEVIILYKCFDQMWLNEETRIAQVLILT